MKIGIDARFFGPESKGLGRYTQKLIEHLEVIDQKNDYVIFLTRENFAIYKPQSPRFTKVLADYRWYTFSEQILLPFIFRRAQCDIIHFPHFNVPFLYRKSFIVTIHDLILLRFPTRKASTRSAFMYWIKFLVYKVIIRSAVMRARHIIAVSHFTKNDIIKHYAIISTSITVTYEAGAEYVHTKDDFVAPTKQVNMPYVLYVGNAYPHKNLTRLVDAFAQWKKTTKKLHQLVLVGRKDYFYAQLIDHIARKKIKDIVILDTVTEKVLHRLYAHADIFVFPSLYEGFGLPPLEACAHGVPVLSSNHACMREILGNAACYIDAKDVDSLAEGIEQITSDMQLRKRLVTAGLHQVKKYTWRKMAEETLGVYKSTEDMI